MGRESAHSIEFDMATASELEQRVRRVLAQHFLADQFYTVLCGFYFAQGHLDRAASMLAERVAFHEKAYRAPHATLATVLEAYADMLAEYQRGSASNTSDMQSNGKSMRSMASKIVGS